jgi:CRISPR system Cascade subunit CasD
MGEFLTFALVAPLASFGSIAVGERRGGWDRPGRSAVLGLLGACLGVDRDDDADQAALADGYGLALLSGAVGLLLADYHTAQVPSAQRHRRFPTRAAELRAPELNTILSRRDYRTGAWHLGAVWPRVAASRWTLPEIAAAMQQPVFTPYLGRKSCPLGLPLAPCIVTAEDAPAALLARDTDGVEAALRQRLLPDGQTRRIMTLDIEDVPVDDPRLRRVETRRDQPCSRRRWQFDLRREAVLDAGPIEAAAQ